MEQSCPDRHLLRPAITAGDIYTITGTGTQGFTGDGGPAADAALYYPQDVAVDGAGDVLVTDSGNNRVRMVAGPASAATAARPARRARAAGHPRAGMPWPADYP